VLIRSPLARSHDEYRLADTGIDKVIFDGSPLWYCLAGLVVGFTITYRFVRSVEPQDILIRL
jgi:hypothetical protein